MCSKIPEAPGPNVPGWRKTGVNMSHSHTTSSWLTCTASGYSVRPWSSSSTVYLWVCIRLCMSTDLTFRRLFFLTTASILVKTLSTSNHYDLSKKWCQNNTLTCAISKELWMQLWFPFPTFGIPFMKSSLGSLCAGNALRDGQDRLFVVFNCILSTGASLILSCSQLFTSCPSSFSLHVGNSFIVHEQFRRSRKHLRNWKD